MLIPLLHLRTFGLVWFKNNILKLKIYTPGVGHGGEAKCDTERNVYVCGARGVVGHGGVMRGVL